MALTPEDIKDLALNALEDMKAKDITCLDVKPMTSMADYMIVCSGTSNRHLKSIADQLIEDSKKAGHQPSGVEGESGSEWVLVDLIDVIVHIMLPDTRKFYDLEKLWSMTPGSEEQG
ncbi:MAG: ribosome silencing factor [Pseudomonadales bacterium]|nr:ribosome silencing factor [Pseudomonadales bacterium]